MVFSHGFTQIRKDKLIFPPQLIIILLSILSTIFSFKLLIREKSIVYGQSSQHGLTNYCGPRREERMLCVFKQQRLRPDSASAVWTGPLLFASGMYSTDKTRSKLNALARQFFSRSHLRWRPVLRIAPPLENKYTVGLMSYKKRNNILSSLNYFGDRKTFQSLCRKKVP